jgi:hypothetical protein
MVDVRCWLSVLVMCAGSATGAEPPTDPLAGPKVEDRDVPGSGNTFGEGVESGTFKGGWRVRPRVFFDAVRAMDGDDAPAEVRLSEDQRERARAIAEEYRESARAFIESRREEFEALRSAAGAERGPRGEIEPAVQPPATPEQAAAREGLRELMKQGPNPEEAYAKVWEILNEAQREFLRGEIEAFESRRMMEVEEPIVRGAVRQRLEEDREFLRSLKGLSREEIREKIEGLPADQREAVMRAWRERRRGE